MDVSPLSASLPAPALAAGGALVASLSRRPQPNNEAITVPTVPDGGTSAHDLARAIETWKQYSRTDGSVDTAGDLLLGYRAHA